MEPASLSSKVIEDIKEVVFHAIDSLKIQNGASHSEIKIRESGEIVLIEILVPISTGIDYVKAVI